MNLKPAEKWVDESRNPNVVVSPAMRDLEIERIRQIQADALRTVVHQLDEANYNVAIRDRVEQWRQLANQLDPRPEVGVNFPAQTERR